MCQVWFHAFSVKSDHESQRRPKGIAVYVHFSIPHPLSSRKLKKALKLPSHRYLPTPTTFHFLPSPCILVPISSSSPLLFLAISPSSLLCTSPLSEQNWLHLTIILSAWMGSESIAHEAECRMGYWLRAHSCSRNNCFIKIQLAGQKYRDKTTLTS